MSDINVTFRPDSMGLDHKMATCDLTHLLVDGSKS